MQCQLIRPTVGARGWVDECAGYPLPVGLPNHSPVTVTAVDLPNVEVEDGNGARWNLLHHIVDCGRRYEVRPGVWKPESDPEVLRVLSERVNLLQSERWQAGADHLREASIRIARHILSRNAHD